MDDKIENNERFSLELETLAIKEFISIRSGYDQNSWHRTNLKEVGIIICGKTPTTKDESLFGFDMPFIKIPDMQNQLFIINSTDKLSRKGALSQKGKTLPPHSLIVSCIATVGLVSITAAESQTNQQINALIPNNSNSLYYLFILLKSMNDELKILGSGGSATLNISTSLFGSIEIDLPPQKELVAFHEKTSPLFEKIKSNLLQNKKLKEMKCLYLKKYFG